MSRRDGEITNARITESFIGIEDHGILSVGLDLNHGGAWHQGTGLRSLKGEWGCHMIRGILDTVGVRDWSKLKGQLVRCRHEDGMIAAIGHILDDRWFDFKAEWEKFRQTNTEETSK